MENKKGKDISNNNKYRTRIESNNRNFNKKIINSKNQKNNRKVNDKKTNTKKISYKKIDNKKNVVEKNETNNIVVKSQNLKEELIETTKIKLIKNTKNKQLNLEFVPVKKNKKRKTNIKKIVLLLIIILILIITSLKVFNWYQLYQEELRENQEEIRLQKEYQKLLLDIKNAYNKYVITNKDANLYNENFEIVGKISKDMYLELDEIADSYTNAYFKLKNLDMYIHFKDIFKTEELKLDNRYKNYIPFNKSVKTNQDTKIYTEDGTYYLLNQEQILPVIIDEIDKYYVEFDNKLVYIFKNNVDVFKVNNSNLEILKEIAILNYHFVINESEKSKCTPSVICHDESQFDSHIKYIKENNFFTITMKELEMFLDSKINLPKKSVSITIDDGWFVERSIPILEKYDVMATLFLIGYLNHPSYYESKNLEIHSHTWNLHDVSNCKGGRSQLLCYNKETIVKDLLKSRESLNNTTYFCYPFYEYNNHTISALKEAGFTMALTGGNRKVKKGINKYKVPRYVIYDTTTLEKFKQIIN